MGIKGVKGVPRIGEPPNDGREWICRDEAMQLFGCSKATIQNYLRRLKLTYFRPTDGSQLWVLKREVEPYAKFLRDRAKWRKRQRPEHWEIEHLMVDEETAKRLFLTSTQVAAMLGISSSQVRQLTRHGKLPVHPSRKLGVGSRYWYSPTAIKNYLADEERLRRHEIYKKGVETRRKQKLGLEGKPYKSHRKYPKIPEGWLLAWEVAERMGISEAAVWQKRRKGYLEAERFPRRRGKLSPWCFHEVTVRELMESEAYQQCRERWAAREPKPIEEHSATYVCHVPIVEAMRRAEEAQQRIWSRMPR